MSAARPVIVLFRTDLRLSDNRALAAAVASGKPVIALFVRDERPAGPRLAGGARRWWLHHSLHALSGSLEAAGCRLVMRSGPCGAVVDAVASETGADTVLWNRRYEPAAAKADASMKARLREAGLKAESFDGWLLHEPSAQKTGTGGPYRVFTPFWKSLTSGAEPRDPVDRPGKIVGYRGDVDSETLDDWALLPTAPDWAAGLRETWTPGEVGASARLADFLEEAVAAYADDRDRPGIEGTSRLSPHLAHGEITPFQIAAALRRRSLSGPGAATFLKEVGWREFCWHLLFHNPDLAETNFNPRFGEFPWRSSAHDLRAWQRGLTGYPIVDAGMRQLWSTGWMHNRVRMIVASFLTKHLRIDWREGEKWFWDTLVDADPASNPASWQWVAGSGADAAPYFRVFNPVLQGEKFDPEGSYVRAFVPELARLPDSIIHRPWDASEAALSSAGVKLGETYPVPVVEHGAARQQALLAYDSIRGGS